MAVNELRSLVNLGAEDQPANQLRRSRIEKDNSHKNALITGITESCDPFGERATSSDHLLNLATGKAASKKTQDYLNGSLSAGFDMRNQFQKECEADSQRFLRPIPRRKVFNFAQENLEKRQPAASRKSGAESVRDVFIHILVAVAENTSFDLKSVMTFPVTAYPLSIAHPDGSGLKTDKSKLLSKLERMQTGFTETPLPPIGTTLIDGGLLLHGFLSAIGTITSYGNLARLLLGHVCASHGQEIHVLFDTYRPNSLKESERRLRGADDRPFVITGASQAPNQSCAKLLQNGSFKDQLALFLLEEWQKDHYGAVMGKKTLVLSYGGSCERLVFDEPNGKMNVSRPDHLQGVHEEADTLMAFHASNARGNVMIRASDTDVLVILLGMLGRRDAQSTQGPSQIIMDCGSGNSRRFIDISGIANALETTQPGLAKAMPGLHAFTGSDYTTSFYRKGKAKPLEILQNDAPFIPLFEDLSSNQTDPDFVRAEEFVCRLYGLRDTKRVDEARYLKLVQLTGKWKQESAAMNLRKVDCALLPPCAKTLRNKVRRAHFVAMVWGSADTPHPGEGLSPLDYGWEERNGAYRPVWYDGPAVPPNLVMTEGDIVSDDVGYEEPEDETPWMEDSDDESD